MGRLIVTTKRGVPVAVLGPIHPRDSRDLHAIVRDIERIRSESQPTDWKTVKEMIEEGRS